VGAPKFNAAHRLFTAYGAVQKCCHLSVDLPPAHVAVLRHRHLDVSELVGADPGDKPASSIIVATDLRKL
jgi:hypothetical protein